MGKSQRHEEAGRAVHLSGHVRALLRAAILAFAAGVCGTAAAEPTVEVITSADRAGMTIDRKLLLSAYIGRMSTWPDGRPITLFVLPDSHPLHVQFSRQLLGTYPYVLRNAWDKLVYTGTGFAPTMVSSEEEMRKRVMDVPGAIGYVSATTDRGPDTVNSSRPMATQGNQQ